VKRHIGVNGHQRRNRNGVAASKRRRRHEKHGVGGWRNGRKKSGISSVAGMGGKS